MKKPLISFLFLFGFAYSFGQSQVPGSYDSSTQCFITSDTNYHIDFFQDGVARIYQMGYIGLMDSTGKILIEPQFDQIFDFEGDAAKVSVRKKTGLINKRGEIILEPFYGEIEPFQNGFAKCKIDYIDSRIVNDKGEFINEYTYDFIGPLDDGRFTFIRDQNFGLLTTEGKEIVVIENYNDTEFNRLVFYFHYGAGIVLDRENLCDLFEFSEGRAITFAKVNDSIKFGFIDRNGKVVIPTKYDRVELFEKGMALVKVGNSWGAVDQNGKTLLPCVYKNLKIVDENHFIISKDGALGVIDNTGSTIIPFQYESIEAIPGGKFIVSKAGRYGVIDKANNESIKIKHPTLIHLFDNLLITHNGKKWGVINTSGKTILPFYYDGIAKYSKNSGVASTYRSSYSLNTGVPRYVYEGFYSEFDENGETGKESGQFSLTIVGRGDNHHKEAVIRDPRTFAPSVVPDLSYSNDQKKAYGVEIELKGGFKIVGNLDTLIANVNPYTLRPSSKRTKLFKFGIINAKGKIIVPLIYDELYADKTFGRSTYFGITQRGPTNLFVAKKGEKYGVINLEHEVVIPFDYDGIEIFPAFMELYRKVEYSKEEEEETDELNEWEYYEEEEVSEASMVDFCGRTINPFKPNNFTSRMVEEWYEDETRQPSIVNN